MTSQPRLWMVRLGKFGEQEGNALETGDLVTGWTVGDLSQAASRDEILPLLEMAYPAEKGGTLQNWAAQLNQLKNVAKAGDVVVTPLKTTNQLAIGQLLDGFHRTAAGNPVRRVKWLRKDLPRTAIKQDLLYSFGATQTVCEIRRNDAVNRIQAAAAKGVDPGYGSAGVVPAAASSDNPDAEVETSDLATLARDQIEKRISSHFAGHAFTQLIAAILNAQGYRTEVSPPGPDRSIDILAGQGPLGMAGPKIVVQVKSGDVVVDQPTLQALIGSITDVHADHGLLVGWSGFSPPVRRRVNELYFRVRLWDRKDIVDALLESYDHLPENIRAELPLQRIWSLVPDSDQVG